MRRDFGLKELDVFVKVIELGSFKEAARALDLTQSALTQRLQKLENALGARLVDRTTRSVAPTPIGRGFLADARGLIDRFERAVTDLDDVVSGRGGRITVASLMSVATYVLPAALRRLRAEHPAVGVRLLDTIDGEIAEAVRRGDAEFAIDAQCDEPAPDLVETPIMHEQLALVCRADHPAADGDALDWEDLAELPLVLVGACDEINRRVLGNFQPDRYPSTWRYQVQHVSTMLGFVESGLGVGIVSSLMMSALRTRDLVQRPLVSPGLERTLVFVERRDAELPPASRRLKDLLADEFEARRADAA